MTTLHPSRMADPALALIRRQYRLRVQ